MCTASAMTMAACGEENAASAGADGGDESIGASSFDAGTPACVSDGGALNGSAVPAFGHFSGAIDVDICAGGASAYVEHASGGSSTPARYLFVADSALSGDPSSFFHFTNPGNAASAELGMFIGISSPSPGTYSSGGGACGNFAFCISFPVPPGVDCGDAGNVARCPPGCSLQGPGTGPSCMPVTPENCYAAHGSSNCLDSETPLGSWTLELSSVTAADGGLGTQDYEVHGGLTATLIGDDAGLGEIDLTMGF